MFLYIYMYYIYIGFLCIYLYVVKRPCDPRCVGRSEMCWEWRVRNLLLPVPFWQEEIAQKAALAAKIGKDLLKGGSPEAPPQGGGGGGSRQRRTPMDFKLLLPKKGAVSGMSGKNDRTRNAYSVVYPCAQAAQRCNSICLFETRLPFSDPTHQPLDHTTATTQTPSEPCPGEGCRR